MTTVIKKLFYLFMVSLIIFEHNSLFAQENQDSIKNFRIVPNYIKVGAFFKGAQAQVTAEIPKCDGVIVELEGKIQEMTLNRKGRKKLLWLNVAQIRVKKAPSIYILASSDKLEKICSEKELEEQMLGYAALKQKIIFESDKALLGFEFDEFIKLKEYRGSYNISNKVNIVPSSDGMQEITSTLDIPSFIPADKYEIFLYCFKDGNLIDKSVADLSINEVGLPLLTKNLAFGKPALYGLFAIIIALFAGIVMGLIFSKKTTVGH